MQSRSAILAIFSVFFFESAVIGQWIPRIPDIKSNLGLSDGQLGMALLVLVPVALLTVLLAKQVVVTATGLGKGKDAALHQDFS